MECRVTRSREPEREEERQPHHHEARHSRRKRESPGGVPQWVLITVILVVTSAWVTNFLVSVFNSNYHPPGSVNTAFITIVGTILVNAAARYRGSNGNKNEENDQRSVPRRPRPRYEDEADNYGDGDN